MELFDTTELLIQTAIEKNKLELVLTNFKSSSKNADIINKKLKQIEKLEKDEKELVAKIQLIKKIYHKEIDGPKKELGQVKYNFIAKLDTIYSEKKITTKQKEILSTYIFEKIHELENEFGFELQELKTKYISKEEFDEMTDILKEEMKDILGSHFDDIDSKDFLLSKDAFFQKHFDLFTKLKQEQELEEKEREKERVRKQKNNSTTHANQNQTQPFIDFNKVYKILAKAIHPDLERDLQIKLLKEQLMQELTVAKDNNNYFKLFLIIETSKNYGWVKNEDIEFKEEQLTHFISELEHQIRKAKNKIDMIKNHYNDMSYYFQNFYSKKDAKILENVRTHKLKLSKQIEETKSLESSINSKKDITQFIKKIQMTMFADRMTDDEDMEYILSQMFK